MNGINKEFITKSNKIKNNNTCYRSLQWKLGLAQGLEVIVLAAAKLVHFTPNSIPSMEWLKNRILINLVESKKLNNISFENSLPRA